MKPLVVTLAVTSIAFVGVVSAQTTPKATGNSEQLQVTRSGSRPAAAGPSEYFTGSVRVQPVVEAKPPSRTSGASVTFEAGARSAWHTHPLGQTLIVTAGVGRVQRWGGPIEEIRPEAGPEAGPEDR